MSDPTKITMVDSEGRAVDVDAAQVADLEGQGYRVEGAAARIDRTAEGARREHYSKGPWNKIAAGTLGLARTVSGGLTDAGLAALGAGDDVAALREYNAGASMAGELTGLVTGVGAVGLANRAAKSAGAVAEGASIGTRVIAGAKGATAEGAIYGAGSGVSELALSDKPVTIERALGTIGSSALFGGTIGAAVGAGTSGVGAVLRKGKSMLDDAARAPQVGDDLATLDAKGLRAAEKTERETLKVAEKAELDSIKVAEKAEADALVVSRAAEQKKVADEIAAFRREIDDQKHFLTTDKVKLPVLEGQESIGKIGREAMKATRGLDNILANPIGMAQNPTRALDALQRYETAQLKLLGRADELRTVFKADATGARTAALDAIEGSIEKNRALQQQLGAFAVKPTSPKLAELAARREAVAAGSMRTSAHLDNIAAAKDVVSGRGNSMLGSMAGGTAFGIAAGAVSAIPIIGSALAPFAGAAASNLVNGGLSKAMKSQAARMSTAVGAFLKVGEKVAPVAPVLASKVLASLAFGPAKKRNDTGSDLARSYKARVAEVKEQTQYDMATGRAVMRSEARERVFDQLAALRAGDPIGADRMESAAARRIAAIADAIPRRPEVGGIPIGPDNWQPSDMEMRAFARFAHAVEDPAGIVERLATGAITPEDTKAMREVYPEMYAEIQQEILSKLPTLRKTLPFQRRLALSIFSGMSIDASMDPRILAGLQAAYAAEPTPPMPTPQMGSVKNHEATPAQERQGLT